MPGHDLFRPQDISSPSEGCKGGIQVTGRHIDRLDIEVWQVGGDGSGSDRPHSRPG
ncbi:hypothetical protein LBMAG38_00830 [Chloroflexota bacterium]|nr:hypothetical protein LBMAG38_00830 [Chloroflexota bacterium]